MDQPQAEVADISQAYDERSPISDVLRDGQMHMWYWYDDADGATLPEAVGRTTAKVASALGLRAGERVLDAGCGPGETAVHLARTYGARVTGITISSVEVARATARAHAAGVDAAVRIEYGDFAELPYPDGTFDAVLALETLAYAADLDHVLAELYRVLRPGGRIALSDFSLEGEWDDRVRRFAAALKINVLPTSSQWLDRLRRAGFLVVEHTQCGPRTFGMKGRYLTEAMKRRDRAVAAFGEAAVADHSRIHQDFFVPRRDQIGYVIVAARKPSP